MIVKPNTQTSSKDVEFVESEGGFNSLTPQMTPITKEEVLKMIEEKKKEIIKGMLKEEMRSWLPDRVAFEKEFILDNNITSELIYEALIETVKELPPRLFKYKSELRFEVEITMYFDKYEKEWKTVDDHDPYYNIVELETEDIVKELEERKEEVIQTIQEALKDLQETEDEEEGEKVIWALSIYFN